MIKQMSRWWQLKYFLLSSRSLGFHDPIWRAQPPTRCKIWISCITRGSHAQAHWKGCEAVAQILTAKGQQITDAKVDPTTKKHPSERNVECSDFIRFLIIFYTYFLLLLFLNYIPCCIVMVMCAPIKETVCFVLICQAGFRVGKELRASGKCKDCHGPMDIIYIYIYGCFQK